MVSICVRLNALNALVDSLSNEKMTNRWNAFVRKKKKKKLSLQHTHKCTRIIGISIKMLFFFYTHKKWTGDSNRLLALNFFQLSNNVHRMNFSLVGFQLRCLCFTFLQLNSPNFSYSYNKTKLYIQTELCLFNLLYFSYNSVEQQNNCLVLFFFLMNNLLILFLNRHTIYTLRTSTLQIICFYPFSDCT